MRKEIFNLLLIIMFLGITSIVKAEDDIEVFSYITVVGSDEENEINKIIDTYKEMTSELYTQVKQLENDNIYLTKQNESLKLILKQYKRSKSILVPDEKYIKCESK